MFGAEFHGSISTDAGVSNKVCLAMDSSSPETLREQVLKLFEHDFQDLDVQQRPEMSVEDQSALSFMTQTTRKEGYHFSMRLPWRDGQHVLNNNRAIAEKRLKPLKTRLLANDDLKIKYIDKIKDYIDSGHAAIAPERISEGKTRYLPHHCTGEKFRVVFDSAAKFRGRSLNSKLLQGPDLNNNLTGVLLRFRQEPVAFAADIRFMFHQVLIENDDRDALRFLWWPDDDWEKPPVDFRMNVLPFGLTCSPSCAAFALQKAARDNLPGVGDEAVQTVVRNFYVDDLLKSCPSVDVAKDMISELLPLLESGGFVLTKFLASHQEILESVPECDRVLKKTDLNIHDGSEKKTLGIV